MRDDMVEPMRATIGCTDGGCIFLKPKGMCTNGGCSCGRELYRALKSLSYSTSECMLFLEVIRNTRDFIAEERPCPTPSP